MQLLDEMLALNLLTPEQHHEIGAWVSRSKTPDKRLMCRALRIMATARAFSACVLYLRTLKNEIIARINRELGTLTMVITHNAVIAEMADRVLTLEQGGQAFQLAWGYGGQFVLTLPGRDFSVVMLNLAYLVVGVVVVEVVFGYNALGQYLVDHVTKRDLPVVQAIVLVFSLSYVLLTLAALANAPLGSTVTLQIAGSRANAQVLQVPLAAVYDPGKGPGLWVIAGNPAKVTWRPVRMSPSWSVRPRRRLAPPGAGTRTTG